MPVNSALKCNQMKSIISKTEKYKVASNDTILFRDQALMHALSVSLE